ncbi:MAG: hypothetical protein ACI8WB_001335 [Phenylobacterium sp.]|jgi:hypothetical protein
MFALKPGFVGGFMLLLTLCALIQPASVEAASDSEIISSVSDQQLTYKQCDTKLSGLEVDAFARHKIFGQWAQKHLATIYLDNPVYQQDYNQPGKKLTDGWFGWITQKWLGYFCAEFALDSQVGNDVFVADLFESLATIAGLRRTYPHWRETLVTANFLRWYKQKTGQAGDCGAAVGCYGNAVELHALFDAFYLGRGKTPRGHQPITAVFPLYYQLTEQDFANWALYNQTLAGLEALVDKQFTSQIEVNNQLRSLLKNLTGQYEAELAQLVRVSAGEIESQPIYSVDGIKLKQMRERLLRETISEDQLKVLQSLQDIVFAQQYLLDVALKLAGFAGMTEQLQKVIARTAEKPGYAPTDAAKPLVWRGTDGCGCAEKLKAEKGGNNFIYGFYPYWQKAPEKNSIDFGKLTRMGYFSASLAADSRGNNQLKLPLNWRPEYPWSQFITIAQKHRVEVDLVVTNQRSAMAVRPQPVTHLYGENLVKEIVRSVKTPLTDYTVNRLKPVLSFGTSAMRTMADGVTLNFELHDMTAVTDQKNFKTFVKQLKQQLSWHKAQEDASGEARQAKIDDAYYLNLMVPVEQLLKNEGSGEGFYTMDNLLDISADVNLFIMVFEQADEFEPQSQLQRMKDLRRLLGKKQHLAEAEGLFKKIVPMLHMRNTAEKPQALAKTLSYTGWSFLGAALWALPLDGEAWQTIGKNYFSIDGADNASALQPVFDAATGVCNVLCPNRWNLRVVLFLLFFVITVAVTASIWIFELRAVFKSLAFMVFAGAASVFILLVLACDPYWKEHQQLIFFAYMVLAALVALMMRIKKSREMGFP